jgi:hypothetical protein
MKFARIVFIVAGIWGIVVLTPLYFLVDVTGRQYAPPIVYPHFFYGFLSVALVWQLAFLLIGTDPERFRPLMIMAILEKVGWVATVVVLWTGSRISTLDASSGVPDALLGVLFAAAFVTSGKTAKARAGVDRTQRRATVEEEQRLSAK